MRMRFMALTAILAVGHLVAAEQEEFRWQGRVAPGSEVEIKGVNGSIEAQASSGDQVEVLATKQGRRSDPRLVNIKVVEHADGVTICALYPSDHPNRPNECRPGEGGRNSVRNNDVKVDFMVRVPAGVRWAARTVNGEIRAESLQSDVLAHTVNGSIRIDTTGHARAKTVNGSITASMGSANWAEALEIETVNGSINVRLPSGASADLQAETVNGDITTDFPLTVQGRFSNKRISGTIGRGGHPLTLKTVNGSIKLHSF